MVFHWSPSVFQWSPSVSKSPQVSRTLHSIIVDLSNAVVRMPSIVSQISNPFLGTILSQTAKIGINLTFIFHILLEGGVSVLWQDPVISLAFRFVLFSLYRSPERQTP